MHRDGDLYNTKCFVCGRQNPSGMRLRFEMDGDAYVTEFVIDDAYQGFPGIMHGGIISTVLDEVMGRYLWVSGYDAVTADMRVRFRKPIVCGSRVRFEGRLDRVAGSRAMTSARAVSEDGTVFAEARACFVIKGGDRMNRPEAEQAVKTRLPNVNLFKHCLAVEAVMRGLARHFGENEEDWSMAGLLHDIDYEETKNDPDRHSLLSGEIVKGMGFTDEIVEAVIAHNERHGLPRATRMAKALYACDPLTGLIVAAALIHPEKRLSAIDTAFVLNRYKEKSFAKGANRKTIEACSDLGLSLEEFVTIGLDSMKGISKELGL